ncbi:hypothetical protein MNV49_003852 [Pseudohyphozyma bogoriensis]|nr:hypothetical protein MNV49_003852 [Pseudohyphozyma bogoriensis]
MDPVASSSSSPAPPPAPPAPRIKRDAPQLLADVITADDLISGPPTKLGGRVLTDDRDPWSHNAWDRVDYTDEQAQLAEETVAKQAANAVPDDLKQLYNADPASYWDEFYARVKDGFFNDRQWLRNEFPELAAAVTADAGPKRIVEIGCGPGNTLFPLFSHNENPELKLHGFDFSKEAVDMVKKNPAFDPKFLDTDVWDLSSKAGPPPSVPDGSVDIVTMIFVMSALHPDEWEQAVKNVYQMLKPEGVLLFRDYGRHDMAQLRFKANRYMQPGLYIRGDCTRVYFFERDELVNIFGDTARPSSSSTPSSTTPTPTPLPSLDTLTLSETDSRTNSPTPLSTSTATRPLSTPDTSKLKPVDAPKFELVQLGVDRRLLLNRKKQLKMYRIWLQGRWRKPLA